MTFKEELIAARDDIIGTAFEVRDGTVVPQSKDVAFNEAVRLPSTYLYADMADSSGLVGASPQETVGKVLRLYLDLSVGIIRRAGGQIRSFDGDRVMGIFIADDRYDASVRAAMQIKWACQELIQPKVTNQYKSIRESGWLLKPGCGVASGDSLLVRGGVRRTGSDLVSIGPAPNLAAKLSDVREEPYHVRIGSATYKKLSDAMRLHQGENMWQGTYDLKMGGKTYPYYRTKFRWIIN